MDEDTTFVLRLLAAQLVGVSAVAHLVVGVSGLGVYLRPAAWRFYAETGAIPDPLPPLFVLSGLAIVGGMAALHYDRLSHRTAYAAGAALMLGYVVGWIAWHTVLGHGAIVGHAPGSGHGVGFLSVVVDHVVELPYEAALKAVELAAAVLLFTLLRIDPRASV